MLVLVLLIPLSPLSLNKCSLPMSFFIFLYPVYSSTILCIILSLPFALPIFVNITVFITLFFLFKFNCFQYVLHCPFFYHISLFEILPPRIDDSLTFYYSTIYFWKLNPLDVHGSNVPSTLNVN